MTSKALLKYMSIEQLEELRKTYAKKLNNLRGDYRVIKKVLKEKKGESRK